MQYPDNDMDELFRKAAEAYPLNTGAANWEKVRAVLAAEEKKPAAGGSLRWIVVILPFLLIGLHLNKALLTSRTKFTPAEATTENGVASVSKPLNPEERTAPFLTASGLTAGVEPMHHRNADKPMLHFQPFRPALTEQHQPPAGNSPVFDDETTALTQPLLATAITPTSEETAGVDSSLAGIGEVAEGNSPHFLNDSLQADLPAPDTRKKATDRSSKKRFYAGLVGGPDISTVKFQRFSKVGFQAGVMVGYAFSDRLAAEAGVLTSQKHYYSHGKHYKSDGYYAPSYARLLTVDGNCRMIELPLALRYTFSRQKRGSLFATAGISSYIMQGEDYNLDYLYPSSGNIATHNYKYTDKDQYWLATLQLSVGYSTKLGSLGNLRFEPYYAFPLKGMGHGRLPVSSFGLRFGVTFPQF
ncbi:MAG: porin family protein [Chitinophagaceae bacterium]|nr:MAG: porin family protein [Chitinophagaceae bacterium]